MKFLNFLLGRCKFYHICGSDCYTCKSWDAEEGYCGRYKQLNK